MSAAAASQGSDVLIVGGGIMGASTALFLRRRGRSVTLLESGWIGQQASGVNFGNVRRQGRPLAELPLSNRASAIWRNFREITGEECEYVQRGHLRICYRDRVDGEQMLGDYARDARPLGLDLEILRGAALHARFPFLGPEVAVGSFSALDGHANPRLAAPALARAARRAGAVVHEHCPVIEITQSGSDFSVRTHDGGLFHAPQLQISAGAWSDRLLAQLGVQVTLVLRGPTMSVTEPVPYAIDPAVGVSTKLEHESVYFRQIPRGNVIIGGSTRGTSYADERRARVVPQNTLSQLRQIQRLAPALAHLNVIRVWSGVESYLPDDQPIMGACPGREGLYGAFGFSGSGFQIGPGVGETMAELIATGSTPIDLTPCRFERFAAVTDPAARN